MVSHEELEHGQLGSIYEVESRQLEPIAVYAGIEGGEYLFKGLSLEMRPQSDVSTLHVRIDPHRAEAGGGGLKPLNHMGGIEADLFGSPSALTTELLALTVAYYESIVAEGTEPPNGLDPTEALERLELYQKIQSGLMAGKLSVSAVDGSINFKQQAA